MTKAPGTSNPVLVIAAPSGAGKTTVARRLVDEYPERFRFSVSATTRPPRGSERDGVDYHFLDASAFDGMIERGDLLEWAHVHGNRYGTPWSEVQNAPPDSPAEVLTVLDIDVQGALQVRERHKDAILLFLFPPSGSILVERLRKRGTDHEDVIRRRLAGALDELAQAEHFDFVVVNDQLDETVATVAAIARAELKRVRDRATVRHHVEQLQREIEEAADTAK